MADMKLLIAVVQGEDAAGLSDALIEAGYPGPTRINSAGGFLKQGNATLFLGVDQTRVTEVMRIIKENCHTRTQYINPLPPIMEPGEFYMPYPVEVQVGGATVFSLDVERYERL